MQGGEELSIDELASNLSTYKDQLHQVRKLLEDDPNNSEYKDMEKELEEVLCLLMAFLPLFQVIVLTEELLVTARQAEATGSGSEIDVDANLDRHKSDGISSLNMESSEISEERLPIGTKIQAIWSDDGEWYDATIEAITPIGYFVSYDEWGNKEEVDPGSIRPRPEGTVNALLEAEREAEATKQAIKRKIAQAAAAGTDAFSRTLPPKLRIEPDDPEDVKAAKRKKIHAFKSKVRFEQLEVTQNKRQNAWQQFQTTKDWFLFGAKEGEHIQVS
ncbi:survival of motor neuron-related-splicing factor 30 isoform X3 [Amborella trichopoda]|uniref:survival of motor neuron-related-splicing factor 30 isoform X3 n=1 Tax=Amborella trichopoda TaxID=13333 RepID=UPI0009BE826A|nr:survival of motor neuron-related-splicing factor 30 isoform X3 [Amborella trichopoda]|eukprot:XP_020518954.1 survival of motor neuron-related-splicing factor 30 isoform X3 [Amborella trichopoda]